MCLSSISYLNYICSFISCFSTWDFVRLNQVVTCLHAIYLLTKLPALPLFYYRISSSLSQPIVFDGSRDPWGIFVKGVVFLNDISKKCFV